MKPWQKWSLIGASIATLAFVCIGKVDADVPTKTVTYTVSQGDTLCGIAHHFDPHANTMDVVMQIEQMNHLSDNEFLQAGQTLQIPIGK